ncbi:Y+L amino acid transporter 2-like [Cherax quadricarinatus]|uniref:Y+L amino acid transporter 2-like n=1 Tax=Cherax quadricarinatus TaxID=27406 RepID=UPI00387EBBA1
MGWSAEYDCGSQVEVICQKEVTENQPAEPSFGATMNNEDKLRMKNKELNFAGSSKTTDHNMENEESAEAELSTSHPSELHTTLSLSKHGAEQTELDSSANKENKTDVHKREPVKEKNVAEVEDVSKLCSEEQGGCGVKLKRELGLLDCVGFTLGYIIGSGIFVSPRTVLQYTGSVGMSLAVWVVSGAVCMCGAFCHTEMSLMIQESGGRYIYLQEAFGPIPAFLYLWQTIMISVPSNRAIGALTFANYILKPFLPDCQDPPQSTLRIVGILLIVTLVWVNSRKVKWATRVQNILSLTKVLSLIMIIVLGIYYLAWGRTHNYDDVMAATNWHPAFIATAFYHTLFTYSGWDNTTLILEEVKDPLRNVPRAITISLTSITIIYVLTNVAYFAVLTPSQMLSSAAVAVVFGNLTMGVMAWMIPILVASSTSGCANGAIFANARVLFVSSRRGQLPRVFSHLHVHNCTPIPALIFIATITTMMFVTSDMIVLINYYSFSKNIFELGTIIAFFWFRIKQPDRHRPIKVSGTHQVARPSQTHQGQWDISSSQTVTDPSRPIKVSGTHQVARPSQTHQGQWDTSSSQTVTDPSRSVGHIKQPDRHRPIKVSGTHQVARPSQTHQGQWDTSSSQTVTDPSRSVGHIKQPDRHRPIKVSGTHQVARPSQTHQGQWDTSSSQTVTDPSRSVGHIK